MSSKPKRIKLSGKASGSSSERSDDEQVYKGRKIDVLDKGETSSSVQQSKDIGLVPAISAQKLNYILVESYDTEQLELPVDKDGSLGIQTLMHAVPEAIGLKYINSKTGRFRALLSDSAGIKLLLPDEDLSQIVFKVIFKENKAPSPYSFVQRSLPKATQVNKYSFFIFNQKRQKTLVTKISAFYFATYQHLDHSHYKVGDEVDVYSLVDDDLTYETVVKFVSKNNDFILLRTDNVGKEPPMSNYVHSGDHVMICGFSSSYEEALTHDIGCINSPRMAEFNGKDGKHGPFLLCTFESKPGDSGGSVWDCDGLVGINVGRTSFSSEYFENDLKKSINNAALFNAKAFVVPIVELLKAKNSIDPPCDDYHPLTAEIGGEILTQ